MVRTALCTGDLLAGKIDQAAEITPRVAELALLGEIAARRDPPEVARAEEHYHRTLPLAEGLGMRPPVAHCRLGLGRLYRHIGERKAEEQVATALSDVSRYRHGLLEERAKAQLEPSDQLSAPETRASEAFLAGSRASPTSPATRGAKQDGGGGGGAVRWAEVGRCSGRKRRPAVKKRGVSSA